MQLTVAVEELYNEAAARVLDSEYGISRAEFEAIQQKDASGIELTAEETQKMQKMQTFVSELGATMSEYYLGNERVISKLVAENEPLVERVLGKIEQMKKTLTGKGDKFSISEKRRIDKALKLYLKAAEAAGNRDLVKRILALREEDEENKIKYSAKHIIDIDDNSELANLISANPSKNPHDIIKDYLMQNFHGQKFVLSDGRTAIMDGRDASKLSGYSSPKGIARIGNLHRLIETAKYHHSVYGVTHKKFVDFHYYEAAYRYKGVVDNVWLNIGTAKNDGSDHIYDITNKKEETLTSKGDSRPVGNAIQNVSSTNSITDSKEKVNSETKYSRKTDQERSTLTKGEAQKQKANYVSDKVYTKAEISKMVESLSGFSSIPKRFRAEIVNDIWSAFNSRYSPEQREMHASFLADKIFARVMQESGDAFDNTSQEDLYAMEREIHKALKRIAKEGGSPSTRSKLEAEFNTSEAGYWKKQRDEALEKIKITGKLMDSASKMRSLKVGDFLKASNFKSDDLKGTVEQLARINFRGNLNVSGTRGLVKKLAEWYTKDNPMLKGQQKGDNDSATFGQYDEYIAYLLNNIANGATGFSNVELTDLNTVITYFNKFVESYAAFPNGQGIQQGSVGIQYNYGKT